MLSHRQKMAIHVAAKAAGIDAKSGTYRDVLNNIGGFGSAADRTASREGYIAVMAFFERRAPGQKLPYATAGYWQEQDRLANPRDSYIHNIHGLANGLGLTPDQLDKFVAGPKMSNGLYSCLDDAPVAWLAKILNALRAMTKRKERYHGSDNYTTAAPAAKQDYGNCDVPF